MDQVLESINYGRLLAQDNVHLQANEDSESKNIKN